jgi:phosphocarrier protein
VKKATAIVSDPVGFHLRAAGRIVRLTKGFASDVTIRYDGRSANAKSIMGLASLAAEFGSEVTVEVTGQDESEALAQIVHLIEVELATPENGE